MAGGPTLPGRAAHLHPLTVDDVELRELVPQVLSVLVRRGADFATAEDAVQEALIRALSAWEGRVARRPHGVAHHGRAEGLPRPDAVRRRAATGSSDSTPNRLPARSRSADDTLRLYFRCARTRL